MLLMHKNTNAPFVARCLLTALFALVSFGSLTAPRVYAADASISGIVSDETTNPVADILVTLYRMVGDPALDIPRWEKAATVSSTATGNYQFVVTPGVYYTLRFADGRIPPQYASEFYGDVQDIWSAPLINVGADEQRTGIDAQLALGGNISGRVTGVDGAPAQGVVVRAYQPVDDGAGNITSGPLLGTAEVSADGTYALSVPYTGNVRVWFDDPTGVYRPEFHADLYQDSYPYRDLFPQAQAIPVTIGATTPGIDAVLEKLGRVTGLVVDRNGQPLTGIYVSAHREFAASSGVTEWPSLGNMTTGADGVYNFSLLLPGDYRICFNVQYQFSDYAAMCYGHIQVERATPVPVNLGQSSAIPTIQLGKYGLIRGKVTNVAGAPIGGAEIAAYHVFKDEAGNAGWAGFQLAYANENGEYVLTLPLGTYRVSASYMHGGPYRSEYYQDVAIFEQALDFVSEPDSVFENINFALAYKEQLRGRVTDEASKPLGNVTVGVYQHTESGWYNILNAFTGPDGHYAIDDLAPGTYYLHYYTNPDYAPEYYNNASKIEDATPVEVRAGEKISILDVQLGPPKATIHIVLDNQPASSQNIRFTGDLGDFRLDDAQPDDRDPYGNTATFVVKPGSYSVRELVPYGRIVAALNCTNGAFWDGTSPAITLTVAGQEEVTCTFVNERVVNLRAQVYYDRNGNGVRNFLDPWLAGWTVSLFDAAGNLVKEQKTNWWGVLEVNNLRAGQYTACELLPPGWRNTQPGQINPSYNRPCHTLTLQPGQNGVLSFGNTLGNAGGSGRLILPSAAELGIEISTAPTETDDSGYEELVPEANKVLFLPLITSAGNGQK